MTLSFLQNFPDKSPTFFVEKIWLGLYSIPSFNYSKEIEIYQKAYREKLEKYFLVSPHQNAKIHTIREDKKDRWETGKNIHFVINNRTKERFQFAPILPAKSVKRFEVKKSQIMHTNKVDGTPYVDKTRYTVFIDDKEIGECLFGHESMEKEDRAYLLEYSDQIFTLAMNDGFKSVTDFFNWFSSGFQGKLISWTDFSYSCRA